MESTHPGSPNKRYEFVAIRGGTAMRVATIGLDIAKHILHVHGADGEGHPFFARAVAPESINLPSCVKEMEVGAAHIIGVV
jgi:hypothetical protein